jgi:hypothetical protein
MLLPFGDMEDCPGRSIRGDSDFEVRMKACILLTGRERGTWGVCATSSYNLSRYENVDRHAAKLVRN